MTPESLFHRLKDDVTPSADQRTRVQNVIMKRIEGSAALARARQEATPTSDQKLSIKKSVEHRIAYPAVQSLFDRARGFLQPSADTRMTIREMIFAKLQRQPVASSFSFGLSKWVAAIVIVAVALDAGSSLFLAPRISAQSPVILRSTVGHVQLSLEGLWQPITQKEIELTHAVDLRTDETGEASILFNNEGTLRMAPGTTISLNTISRRPAASYEGPTLTLVSGKIWFQAFLPDQLPGFSIATTAGTVMLHAGSLSLEKTQKGVVHLEAWDRHVTVQNAGKQFALVAGEAADLTSSSAVSVTRLPANAYKRTWVAQNLERDAVHQREVAQLQQERRSAEAGILPNSVFYSVKRAAENVDVFLTLDPQARIEKRLAQASTRLNEASVLLAQGDSGALIALDEYKATLLSVASGSGDNVIAEALVHQEVAENSADVSATSPDDALYVLKKTVLETSAALPNTVVNERDVKATLLVDSIDALHDAVRKGDSDRVELMLVALAPELTDFKRGGDTELRPEARREVNLLLTSVAVRLEEEPQPGMQSLSADVADTLAGYLPDAQLHVVGQSVNVVRVMTDAEVGAAVRRTMDRINEYETERGQLNMLLADIKRFEGNENEGRYLRHLFEELPEGTKLSQRVRHRIQQLRTAQVIKGVGGIDNEETK